MINAQCIFFDNLKSIIMLMKILIKFW